MSDKKKIYEGYQPVKKGYQPTSTPKPATDGKVNGGYRPSTSETKPKPSPNTPPKKP